MKIFAAFSLAALALFAGCTIATNVRPATLTKPIEKIYVESNPRLLMAGLIPEVISQIRQLGFEAEEFSGAEPKNAVHVLRIDARWNWDLAMNLTYFQAMLAEDGRIVGTAEYDARMGGANMGKFGHTADKIRPLLIKLLSQKS